MTDQPERRVYYADCYWLMTAGHQGHMHHCDYSVCALRDEARKRKHPDLNITGCTRDCSDYRDGEGGHF